MTKPQRIRLSRAKGFNLQDRSRAINGLPARAVTRPGPFGNPFDFRASEYCWTALAYGEKGDPAGRRAASVKAFREWITAQRGAMRIEGCGLYLGDKPVGISPDIEAPAPPSSEQIADLRGYNLACHCPLDQPCHADVLLELANAEPDW